MLSYIILVTLILVTNIASPACSTDTCSSYKYRACLGRLYTYSIDTDHALVYVQSQDYKSILTCSKTATAVLTATILTATILAALYALSTTTVLIGRVTVLHLQTDT
jgi:hypothetical protein